MTYLQALSFGLLQGTSEFLPVSSSGHLIFLRELLGLQNIPRLFDVILHGATLLVVFVVFRERISDLLGVLFRFLRRKSLAGDGPRLRFIGLILSATVVTGIIGLTIKDSGAENHPKLVSSFFLLTAAFLAFGGWRSPGEDLGQREGQASQDDTETPPRGKGLGVKGALLVGLAQGIAVLPGISRSGSTISAALLLGMDRRKAGEFSFLLSIPAVLGALILELKDLGELSAAVDWGPMMAGFALAFGSGLLALRFLLNLVRQGRLGWFALYLVPLGLGGLFFL